MLKKRIAAALLTMVLALAFSGCGKKEPMPVVAFDGCTLELGASVTLPVIMPAEEAAATLGEVPAGLEATFEENNLTIKGVTPGQYTLNMSFVAKGYEDGVSIIPVTVKEPPPPPLKMVLSAELLGLNIGVPSDKPIAFTLESGTNVGMVVYSSSKGAVVTAQSSDPCLAVAVEGSKITLKSVESGSATLTVTASLDGFADAVAVCDVTVKPMHTMLVLAPGTKLPIPAAQGQTVTIPVEYDGALSVSVNSDIAATTQKNGEMYRYCQLFAGNPTL